MKILLLLLAVLCLFQFAYIGFLRQGISASFWLEQDEEWQHFSMGCGKSVSLYVDGKQATLYERNFNPKEFFNYYH